MGTSSKIPQVGILVSTNLDWGRRIVKGILAYANKVGPWHILVYPHMSSSVDEMPKGWEANGIIGRITSPELANKITQSNLPVINVADTTVDGFSFPCVRTDDRAATRMAAEYFIQRGFRNLAYIGSSHIESPTWYGNAFKEALKENGLRCEMYFVKGHGSKESVRLNEWLHALPKPVGILTWGHGNGRMVVDCCMEAGIPVPHDISVLSGIYDDLLSHACFPSLSGLLIPTEQIGYKAAQLLHDKLEGHNVPDETIFLPPLGVMERLSSNTLAVEDPKLIKVVQFLREHAYESITMNDVLKEVPMARRSLERRFEQVFGRSPVEEIRRLRIDKARQLLAETDLPMQEIAETCGFATYNYLTHVFKKSTGMTPRDYRKSVRTY